ncbi:MAG TPA: hypothetical protein DDX39_03870 [Bacteroidales bacterium]|nr:MAG: hypothetical protein A2W98_09030 [Bacteroidetes bacterium GWF2_33_38]OFY73368.1 MAG: hypothetical protein A2265_02390 [Bacteroidetes bacterium RIFOXYA12_FULL_33_9]OFY88769.1 MAG: hypothetical protein A2236_03755 [Bacteroidetes bacterium RIFOXYA2_FULL_33_7]HBF87759.1 hypothetical protein [Bacteroidales bacterium]
MFGDLMGKLKEAQKQMEQIKGRLNNIYVNAESTDKDIKVTINGNRVVRDIVIDKALLINGNTEELQNKLVHTINKAIEQANKLNESEMQGAAKSMLPGFPGL